MKKECEIETINKNTLYYYRVNKFALSLIKLHNTGNVEMKGLYKRDKDKECDGLLEKIKLKCEVINSSIPQLYKDAVNTYNYNVLLELMVTKKTETYIALDIIALMMLHLAFEEESIDNVDEVFHILVDYDILTAYTKMLDKGLYVDDDIDLELWKVSDKILEQIKKG